MTERIMAAILAVPDDTEVFVCLILEGDERPLPEGCCENKLAGDFKPALRQYFVDVINEGSAQLSDGINRGLYLAE